MSDTLRVGSFNIQAFSIKKISNPEVSSLLVRIIRRYDVCLLMEVRDSSGEVIDALLQLLAQPTSKQSMEAIPVPRSITATEPAVAGIASTRTMYANSIAASSKGSQASRTSQVSIRRKAHRRRSLVRVISKSRSKKTPSIEKPKKEPRKAAVKVDKSRSVDGAAYVELNDDEDDDAYSEGGDEEDDDEEDADEKDEEDGDSPTETDESKAKADAKPKTSKARARARASPSSASDSKEKTATKSKPRPRTRTKASFLDDIPKVDEADLPYLAVSSEPLGRTNHKERYVYIYNRTILRPLASRVYTTQDVYERPPFACKFEFVRSPGNFISLTGLHTQPKRTVEELDALPSVYARILKDHECSQGDIQPQKRVVAPPTSAPTPGPIHLRPSAPTHKPRPDKKMSKLTRLLDALTICIPCIPSRRHYDDEEAPPPSARPTPVPAPAPAPAPILTTPAVRGISLGPIIMGDFNAGYNYCPRKARVDMKLFNDPQYVWGIPDEADTTVRGTTNNAYDRILWPRSQGRFFKGTDVWMFPLEWDIPEEDALRISDHYPVSLEVRIP